MTMWQRWVNRKTAEEMYPRRRCSDMLNHLAGEAWTEGEQDVMCERAYHWPDTKHTDWLYQYRSGKPCRTRVNDDVWELQTPFQEFGEYRRVKPEFNRIRTPDQKRRWWEWKARQYGDIVEYDDKMAIVVDAGKVTYYTPLTLWRRFTMWFKSTKIVALEAQVSRLQDSVKSLERRLGGEGNYGLFGGYGTSLNEKQRDLRRDFDLLMKKHKLCIKHLDRKTVLVKCSK